MKIKAIMISLLVATLFTGCRSNAITQGETRYFRILSIEEYGVIMYDTRTGVEYWCSDMNHSSGFATLLVDKDGKPLIYGGYDKE